MADQKALRKRLKVIMLRPENQICSDCPEKKPTWASLIVPPQGAPPGTEKIGAFCCLECSGSHRRMGVHISFVRSVNLDSWKEKEVRAMENGGNAKVNAIFEARLANSGKQKPTHLADGPTRERFIRDKYERRKYFHPDGYGLPGNSGGGGGVPQGPQSGPSLHTNSNNGPGNPSDVARQRVANRQAQMKPVQRSNVGAAPTASTRPKVAAAPVSAPMLDLLDFSAAPSAPAPAPSATPIADPFAVVVQVPTASAAADPFAAPAAAPPQLARPPTAPAPTTSSSSSYAIPGQEFMTPAPAQPAQPAAAASSASIMALFNTQTHQAQPNGGAYGMPNTNHPNMMGMMGGMMPQQAQPNNNMMMNNATNNNNNMQQQQQQQQMMMQQMMMNNPQMANMANAGGGMNPQMMGMMNKNNNMQQQQQHTQTQPQMNMMMMMGNPQQQQQQQQQQQMMMMGGGGGGGMMNANNNTNHHQMHSMMQGMQHMNMGGMPPQAQQIQQTTSADSGGGFGSPMGSGGGGQPSMKDDPFSSLGGMNAFR